MSYQLYGASFIRIFAISENRAQNENDVLSFGTSFMDRSKCTAEKLAINILIIARNLPLFY
jgi:hypothetical protein